MFNTAILDVALGLIFIYLLLSLMCTAANEIIELLLKKRAIDLERGIRELLVPGSASGKKDIVKDLYNHPLINGLFGGSYEKSGIATRRRWIKRTKLPSYIPARNFSLALMDLIRPAVDAGGAVTAQSGTANATVPSATPPSPNAPQVVINLPPGTAPAVVPPASASPNPSLVALRAALASNPQITEQIKKGLLPLIDAAGNDVAKVRENIESWYNASMDRVSSWYKRRAQVTILILGLFIAITVNVDTITIAKRLSTDKALRDSLVTAADAYAKSHASASPTPKLTGAEAKPGPTSLPAASPTPVASPSPSPIATPLASPAGAPADSPSVASSPSASVTPSSTPVVTATVPTASSTPDELPAICKTEPTSGQCVREKSLQAACKQAHSDECKEVKDILSACKDLKSTECKRGTEFLAACEESNSKECLNARNLQDACRHGDSPNCRYLENLKQLSSLGLPIGWGSTNDPKHIWAGSNFFQAAGWKDQIYWHGLGWILTALALSLGAPFWFDLLNKFIVIRSAVKPHEKSPEEGSKD